MASPNEALHEGEPLLDPGQPGLQNGDTPRPASQLGNESEARTWACLPSKWLTASPDVRSTSLRFRIAAAMFSFVVLGMTVSTLGVMVPQFEAHYGLSDLQVSLIFLVWPVGYVVAAYVNGAVHRGFGQRGIAVAGPAFHVAFAAAAALHPPFPALLHVLGVGSLGTALLDGSLCAWAGGMPNANVVQGFLHGSFSAGAALGPFLAGTMLSVGEMPWYSWYYVLLGASVLEAVILGLAFRFEDSEKYDNHLLEIQEESAADTRAAIFRHSVTWICAAYFLSCVGTESAISGWVVVYMSRVNELPDYVASLSSSGFWIGQALGRLILGFVTNRVGVRIATIAYLAAAIALELLCALVRINIPIVPMVAIMLLGFCLGPLFPSGIVMMTRLLPRELHVGAISFVVLVGQVGGALLPFALGALANTAGIQVFQLVVLAQLFVTLLIWLTFPKLPSANAFPEN